MCGDPDSWPNWWPSHEYLPPNIAERLRPGSKWYRLPSKRSPMKTSFSADFDANQKSWKRWKQNKWWIQKKKRLPRSLNSFAVWQAQCPVAWSLVSDQPPSRLSFIYVARVWWVGATFFRPINPKHRTRTRWKGKVCTLESIEEKKRENERREQKGVCFN